VIGPERVLAEIGEEAWLVGGAVRDHLLGRATSDYDLAVPRDPRTLARKLARATGGHAFNLSDGFGAWRVVGHDHAWQVDVLPLVGGTIETDLANRDLTINAIAQPVSGGKRVDPFDGVSDLQARRLRMVSTEAFRADPLRVLRLTRLACELGFRVEPRTGEVARATAARLRGVAPERIFSELKRIVICERLLDGLALMDELGATEVLLPELTQLRGVEQSAYHHLDVHDHTRVVLAEVMEITRNPGRLFPVHGEEITAILAEPLANELTRSQALRFGALFHDVAKPRTRAVTPEGRITFIGHDASGADMARAVLTRLRASHRLSEYVADLVRHHLRLGFLVHDMPLSRRAIYRYLQACDRVAVDVTLLSVADRLATRGKNSEPAIARHLELARQLIGEALAWRTKPPRPPVGGRLLARELGLEPGPEVGRLLQELEEASFAGEISSPAEAIARAKQLVSTIEP
jgi:poly(A) polymerase